MLALGCKWSAIQRKLGMVEASGSQTSGKLCFHSAQHAVSLLEETLALVTVKAGNSIY